MTHPWHDLSAGENAPEIVTAVIEIPRGCKGKYELDKDSGMLKLDRVLYSSVHYPANYGFIPQTYCEDHDPLDILVITTLELPPMCLIECRVIGVMRMVDQGESDDKIIAVAVHDMSVNHIYDMAGLPPHTSKEIQRFFEDYKLLEEKEVRVDHFLDREEAVEITRESMQMYKDKFSPEAAILA
ncbi:MAG: inorganic pyrophosphatase [Sphingobacteriales bacterium]|jgi:inorganic pyrophosphatase